MPVFENQSKFQNIAYVFFDIQILIYFYSNRKGALKHNHKIDFNFFITKTFDFTSYMNEDFY